VRVVLDKIRSVNYFGMSLLLHSTAIVAIALGPTYYPELFPEGVGGDKKDQVDFEISGGTSPLAISETPVLAPAPAEPAKPIEVSKPVEIKSKVEAPKKVVSTSLPEKTVKQTETLPAVAQAAPQANLPAEVQEPVTETESEPVDPQYSVLSEESEVAVQKETEPAMDLEKRKAEEMAEAARLADEKQARLAQEEAAKEEADRAEAAAAEKAQAEAQAQAKAKAAAMAQAPKQNFLELRQAGGNQPPKYTEEMRIKRMEGRGQLVYYVTKSGQVSDLRLSQSTGHSALDQAAVDAFKKYRFIPGQEGYTVHNFEFRLNGPAQSADGRLRANR